MKRPLLLLVLAFTVALNSGCGYSLANKSSLLPHGKSMDVRMFANRTYQPGIEAEFRRALVNELLANGEIVGGQLPDYTISGEIVALSADGTAFSAVDRVMMYRATIEIRMQVVERKSEKVVWKGAERVREDFPANSDLALQRNAREAAISAITAKAARILTTRMNQLF